MDKLSYASDSSTSAWNTYLQQIERVAPYLGELSPWVDTLRHPKRALIVDIPVQMDDGVGGQSILDRSESSGKPCKP